MADFLQTVTYLAINRDARYGKPLSANLEKEATTLISKIIRIQS